MGRAARNQNGEVIMYADKITDSMRLAIDETNRRREIQMAYNEKHGITPTTIKKEVRDVIRATVAAENTAEYGKKEINRSEEHTSELQSRGHLVCRLLLEKRKK